MRVVRKPWGKELWIAQEKEYGGKILIMKGNRHTSQHFHKDKKETIYCFKDQVDIILNDIVVKLKEGDNITLLPRTVFRMIAEQTRSYSKYQLHN